MSNQLDLEDVVHLKPNSDLLLLTTGGTIATLTGPDGETIPALGGHDLARSLGLGTIHTESLSLSSSWTFGPTDMQSIALQVRDFARTDRWDGLVVTHGTSTMEYTAFLTDLFLDRPIPVVFTGAMQPGDAAEPDGPANLRHSFRLAGDPQASRLGVVLCMHGKIFSARDSYKKHRTDNDAFEDLQGDVGTVTESVVVVHRVPKRPVVLGGAIDTSVALIKAYPGAEGHLIDTAVKGGARGIVIEGFAGSGGIPSSMQVAIRRWAPHETIFVISSRAPAGRIPSPPTGGTGSPLHDLDLLSAGSLTSEKAWVLLMACLGEGPSGEEARNLFRTIAT